MSDSKEDETRRPAEETTPTDQCRGKEDACGRRRFLTKVGLSGATAGLAHFMLLGGPGRAAHAQLEPCDTLHDTCAPSAGDPDDCQPAGTDPYTAEVGDECVGSPADEDDCMAFPYTTLMGDECNPEHSSGDYCDYLDGISTADAAKNV